MVIHLRNLGLQLYAIAHRDTTSPIQTQMRPTVTEDHQLTTNDDMEISLAVTVLIALEETAQAQKV